MESSIATSRFNCYLFFSQWGREGGMGFGNLPGIDYWFRTLWRMLILLAGGTLGRDSSAATQVHDLSTS